MQYISIREVADRVLMHPKLQGVTLEKVIIYATQLMRLLRVPPACQDVIAEIEIDKHRGVLPEDFFMINQVRYKHSKLVLKAASDTFHLAEKEKEHYVYPCYNIQGKWIITSSLDRPIEISYKSIPVDCDGYPLIPDNEAFIKALEAYIKENIVPDWAVSLELISSKETVGFYQKHGFEERPCDWDGPGMFKMIR